MRRARPSGVQWQPGAKATRAAYGHWGWRSPVASSTRSACSPPPTAITGPLRGGRGGRTRAMATSRGGGRYELWNSWRPITIPR